MKRILVTLLSIILILAASVMPVYAAPPAASGNTITVIAKVDNNPDDSTNFTVTLYKDGEFLRDGLVSQSKPLIFSDVPSGKYTLVEKPTTGYESVSISPSTISVKGRNNGYTFTVTNKVIVDSSPTKVTGVTLDQDKITLEVNQTQTLVATVSPDDATDKTVSWSSSDPSIATVDPNGLVSAVSAGTAAITVTTNDGSYNAVCSVEVTEAASGEPNPQPSTIHYVALGDSIATGTTSRGNTTSYVYGFYENLKTLYTNTAVTMTNLSNDGDDSTDLLTKLSDPTFAAEVGNADIITISIGGNNILGAGENSFSQINNDVAETGTAAFENEYASIILKIRDLNPNAKIISNTLYNPYNSTEIRGYTDDPALHSEVAPYIARINNKIQEINDANYKVADVHSRFLTYANGNMGSITYFYPSSWFKFTRDPHPNQAGQNVITEINNLVFSQFN